MIDDLDASSSILRLLVAQGLKGWSDNALLELIVEEDVIVRTAAARELQNRGGDTLLFGRIRNLSNDVRPYVREISAFILGQFGAPHAPYKKDSLPTLMSLTLDSDADVRAAAAAAFGHLCFAGMPQEVEDRLVQLCSDKDRDVKACAVYALCNSSGSDNVRSLLNGLLADDYVGEYAELALEILDDRLINRG